MSASPVGGEVQVNTTTAGTQATNQFETGAVAMDANGNYVVTWSDSGQDGDGYGVFGQRYNAAGVAQGGEFQVNTTTADFQRHATVAMDDNGDFVITWTSYGQDGSGTGVYAQRYNAAGVAQGVEFRVNATTAGNQRHSTVAMDADGDFVITWSSAGQDGSGYGVYAQRYNSAGVAQGGEFPVNSTIANNQRFSSVAMDADGDFVITWSSYGQDGNQYGIYAQRYTSAGATQGGEFQVSQTAAGTQRFSTVAMDADGDFVVAWESQFQDNGVSYGVYARRYNAGGVAQGGEFQVNTTTTNNQRTTSVAMDESGDFVITWNSAGQDTGDLANQYGIYGQQYNSAGVAQGGEFQVNTTTADTQISPAVAMDANGDFVVVWTSYNQDGSGGGVYSQRYVEAVNPVGTTLEIIGTNAADSIFVTLSSPTKIAVNFNGSISTFDLASITDISITGNDGDDVIIVSNTVTLPTTITGDGGNDKITLGGGNETVAGGTGNDTYVFVNATGSQADTLIELAGEGTETLSFGSMTDAVTVNLTSDAALAAMINRVVSTGAAGQAANFENVTGGSGSDILTGNAANNLIYGTGGADTISGGAGDDMLSGGAGNDILNGDAGNDVFTFVTNTALGSDTVSDSSGIDSLNFAGSTNSIVMNLGVTTAQAVNPNLTLTLSSATSLENLYGGFGNDGLAGNSLNNLLFGDSGGDTLAGGLGDDTYVFANATSNETDTVHELAGQGTDTLNFAGLTSTVTSILSSDASLVTMTNRLVKAAPGQAVNIENIVGGLANDVLFGNAANNVLTGGAGNDVLNGGAGNDTYTFSTNTALGSDSVTDGSGIDELYFGGSTNAVVVNLGLTTPQIVNANLTLTLASGASIENATGGSGNDTLIGNALANRLSGGGGNDVLVGGAGNDSLEGGPGINIMIGGAGADHIVGGDFGDLLLTATYQFEQNVNALAALLAEWASANPYFTRITHLTGVLPGGANGGFTFTQDTVIDDFIRDTLTGGAGRDWFIGTSLSADTVTDRAVDEVFTQIDALP